MRPYRKADDDMTPPSQIESVIVWNEKDDDDGRYEFRDASNDYVGKERTLRITDATIVDATDTEATNAPDYSIQYGSQERSEYPATSHGRSEFMDAYGRYR